MTFRIAFFGTAPFGFPVLKELKERYDVELLGVISQPDRKRGRGQKKQSPPVAEYARELELPLYQPQDINSDGVKVLKQIGPIDVGILIAYGQFLDPEVYNYPRLGCFNFHASLLPRWRGAAPIRHTLLAGDDATGVTIFQLEEGMDTGPICRQVKKSVGDKETYGQLYERLSKLNVEALDLLMKDLKTDDLKHLPQEGEATYAPLISTGDAEIEWSAPARAVERRIRAFCPDPGAFTFFNEERVKIFSADVVEMDAAPATVIQAGSGKLIIACGSDALEIKELQPAGSRKMQVEAFLAGRTGIVPGDCIQ